MATITLEVRDRERAIALLEAALQKEAAHAEMGIVKTRRRLEEFEGPEQNKLSRMEMSRRTGAQPKPLLGCIFSFESLSRSMAVG